MSSLTLPLTVLASTLIIGATFQICDLHNDLRDALAHLPACITCVQRLFVIFTACLTALGFSFIVIRLVVAIAFEESGYERAVVECYPMQSKVSRLGFGLVEMDMADLMRVEKV